MNKAFFKSPKKKLLCIFVYKIKGHDSNLKMIMIEVFTIETGIST